MIVLSRKIQTARKQHYCDSCCRKIEDGEDYERQRCVDGGAAWVFKAHMHCMDASRILSAVGIDGDDGCYINVSDMDAEDRAIVFAASPETFAKCWPQFLHGG